MPVARMTSTSRMLNYTSSNPNTTFERVQGIRTSASNVYGGITSGDTYSRMYSSARRSGLPDDPHGCYCHWEWDDELGMWVCTICGSTMSDDDYFDGNFHEFCPCPIGCDWKAILFLSALAGWYAMYKVRNGKKTQKNELIA